MFGLDVPWAYTTQTHCPPVPVPAQQPPPAGGRPHQARPAAVAPPGRRRFAANGHCWDAWGTNRPETEEELDARPSRLPVFGMAGLTNVLRKMRTKAVRWGCQGFLAQLRWQVGSNIKQSEYKAASIAWHSSVWPAMYEAYIWLARTRKTTAPGRTLGRTLLGRGLRDWQSGLMATASSSKMHWDTRKQRTALQASDVSHALQL